MGVARVIVFSDPHCPFHDLESVEFALETIDKRKNWATHVINLGDLFEFDAGSKWDNEYDHDLISEYEAGAGLLDKIFEMTKECQHIWLYGNHEWRINNLKKTRAAAHWMNSKFAPSFERWRTIDYGYKRSNCYELGQVIFKHGLETRENIEACKWRNLCGGHAHRLVVGGHTHRPKDVTEDYRTQSVSSNTWYMNTGTLGPLNPGWTAKSFVHKWGPAVGLIECVLGRACLPAINWEAELVLP